jgi:hypothetical protein
VLHNTSVIRTTRPEPAAAVPAPRHRGRIVALSALAGVVLSVVWSATLVDSGIGDTVADNLLGHSAKQTAVTSVTAGIALAFVSGLAGSFTACNIAAFGAIAPLLGQAAGWRQRLSAGLVPLGWLAAGAVTISGLYGAFGVYFADHLPQLSDATLGDGFPVRLVQASAVFVVIGLIFVILGLAAVDLVPDPIAPLTARFAPARMVIMGALIGAFLIGRPFPLFHKMFAYAAQTHDPLYGAAAFMLQSLGNIVVLGVIFLGLTYAGRGRLLRVLSRSPGRLATISAVAFLVSGIFLVVYWGVRLPAHFHIGWFPAMPWNS